MYPQEPRAPSKRAVSVLIGLALPVIAFFSQVHGGPAAVELSPNLASCLRRQHLVTDPAGAWKSKHGPQGQSEARPPLAVGVALPQIFLVPHVKTARLRWDYSLRFPPFLVHKASC